MKIEGNHHAPSDDGVVLQEHAKPPLLTTENKKDSSIMEYVEKTVDAIEKGVNAVDPLNIFAPCVQPTRLVLKTGFYSSPSNEAFPIVECRTGFSYHNLQARSMENGLLVMEDTSTGKVAVIVEHTGEKSHASYEIFKTSPVHDGQEPFKKYQDQDLYALAKIEYASSGDLQVLMGGEKDPTYTIERAGIPANYATNYFIKQVGIKEEVASTHPWEGNNYMLVVNPGMDVPLMLVLAAISDDAKASRTCRKSFAEMVDMVNARTLVSKFTSSSKSDIQ